MWRTRRNYYSCDECPPALQAWSLSLTPSSPQTFLISSIYANMDYRFWRTNNILELEHDRDHYSLIIWYIWKDRNDKLFRGIDREPLELVRYAESECQTWYNEKETIPAPPHAHIIEEPQVSSLGNICMVNGSWTFTAQFSGSG